MSLGLLLTVLATCPSIAIGFNAYGSECNILNNNEYITTCSNEQDEPLNRSPNFNIFNGTATTITVNQQVSSIFYYAGYCAYYYFYSASRQCLSLNYSGPNASVKVFYKNFFLNNDYLTSVSNINNAIDCFYFDMDTEYIIQIKAGSLSNWANYSFQLTRQDTTNFANHEKYAFHQTFDSSSNVGFHYEIVYFDVSDSTYTASDGYLNSYSTSTSFVDAIDNNHWFFDPNLYNFNDNRRVVTDTGYDEYSAISYANLSSSMNSLSKGYFTRGSRFTGTFVSESVVLTCAHAIFPTYYEIVGTTNTLITTGLSTNIYFNSGVNDYSSTNYYGKYKVNELYGSLSYIMKFGENGYYSLSCCGFDWTICLTEVIQSGTRTHSYMGVSHLSIDSSQTYWPYARSAGYPSMKSAPSDINLYQKTLWASYPLEQDVTINGNVITGTNTVITSAANSGGPLYFKNYAFENGHFVTIVHLLGIVAGGTETQYVKTSNYYRNSISFINIVDSILSASST